MINFWRDRLFRQTWHPTFDELVQFLDGELGPKRDRVGDHTKNCWSCRLKLQKIDRAIAEFMEARNASFSGSAAMPARALPKFAAKLDQIDAELGRPSLFSELIREYMQGLVAPRVSTRLAIFLASLVLLGVIILPVTQPVSAKEILLRIKQAEARQMMQVATPVIYEKLQLKRGSRRRTETVTWEIWNDTRNKRLRQKVRDEQAGPVADFGAICRRHQADPTRPLSSDNYEIWRSAIPQESEQVIEGRLPGGEKATILKVSGRGPFGPDSIIAAELTVRAEDWHPVGQRLLVRKEDEVVDYSLGEVAFDVIALNRVPPSIFAEPSPVRAVSSRMLLPRLLPVPVHLDLWPAGADLIPGEAELTAAEVEAYYAIHSVKACMGRPLEVRMSVGRIEVEGVVDTEARKGEVLLALRGIPYVTADIRSVEAAPLETEIATSVTAASDTAQISAEAAKARLATEELLKHYFGSGKCSNGQVDPGQCIQDEVASLSRESLKHSEKAHAQAWALRRLVEWAPFLQRSELRTATRRLLELMVRDHMEELRKELQQSQAQLGPVLAALAAGNAQERPDSPIGMRDSEGNRATVSLLQLCARVEETVNLTLGVFAETNRPASQPERAMKELLLKLAALNSEYPGLETDVSADLSGLPKTALSSETPEAK